MGVFEQFPYTNIHNLNLDWILAEIKEFKGRLDDWETIIDSIPPVVQTTGTSTTSVMSQKAVTDELGNLLAAIPNVVQSAGSSTSDVMSQDAVTALYNAVASAIPTVVQSTGTSMSAVMSQDAVTGELMVLADSIPDVEQSIGTSTTKVMSQKAVTDALENIGGGVKSIERYHQAGTAVTPDTQNQEQVYSNNGSLSHLTDGHSSLYASPSAGTYRIKTVIPGEADNVAFAAIWPRSTPDVEGATQVWTASNEDVDPVVYEIVVTIPAAGCLTINNYDATAGSEELVSIPDPGIWVWDGLPDGSVTASKIASNAVVSGKIASGAVTESKIAAGAITSAKFNTAARAPGVEVVTSAPTADNTDGLKFAVLNAEPVTYYDGWVYLIKESVTP